MKLSICDNHEVSWRKYGRDDPYFGVLTEERFRSENLDDAARADFFATGEAHVEQVLSTIARHVAPDLRIDRALDFGCGVGRLLLPFGTRFKEVAGVDISEDYLAETAANARKAGLSNLQLATHLEELSAKDLDYDLLHSCIVFNHIPMPTGLKLLGQMANMARDGGVLAVQMLHKRHALLLRRMFTWGRRTFAPLNWVSNILRGRSMREPVMQANEYSLDVVIPLLRANGARDFHLQFTQAFGDTYVFLFCRIDRAIGRAT